MKLFEKAPEMIVMIGIPGSGKSTFCQRNFSRHRLISLDVLRSRHQENETLQETVIAGESCVIDNTNVTKAERAKYIIAAKTAGYRVIGYYFRSRIDECLVRNAQRSGKKRIPDAGVIGRAQQLELPEFVEGFDELYYVFIEDGNFAINKWEVSQCEK